MDIVNGVLRQKRPLDELLEGGDLYTLPDRDRALVRIIVATVLRRLGTLRHLLGALLEKGLPQSAPLIEAILLTGAAQILLLDVPDHAAVDLSVRLAQADDHASHYSGLVNAVLRKLARDGKAQLAALDAASLDTPAWLMRRWTAHYGEAAARAIAAAHTQEPALDLTVKGEPEQVWAEDAQRPRCSPTGSVRAGRIRARYRSLPATTTARGGCRTPLPPCRRDCSATCAANRSPIPAPRRAAGTAQLAAAGAQVTAVDRSARRLGRLRAYLPRLHAQRRGRSPPTPTTWQGGPFDAILLDAPCSSTGTIRRHPDIRHG